MKSERFSDTIDEVTNQHISGAGFPFPVPNVAAESRNRPTSSRLGSYLELSRPGHVLDAFERFVFLAVHVQAIYFQTFRERNERTKCR